MADDGVSEETKNQILQEQARYGLCTIEQDIKKICQEAPEVKKVMENAIRYGSCLSVGQGSCQILEVAHSLDKFYAIDQDEQIFSFGITADSISDKELVVREPERIMFQPKKKYLVLANDIELWMVYRHFEVRHDHCWTTGFDVFKANFEQGEWVEKDTLGDVTLFLGENCSISVPASKLGCKSDCIFYNQSIVGEERLDFGVYFIKDRKLIPHAGHLSRRKQDKLSQPYIRNARKLIVKANYPPAFVVPTCWL